MIRTYLALHVYDMIIAAVALGGLVFIDSIVENRATH